MSQDLSQPLQIVILTGATGRTGKQVVDAALAQFPQAEVNVVVKSNVRSAAKARQIVRQASEDGAILCHTLVEPEVREAVSRQAEALLVPAIDVLGPVINALSDQLQLEPENQPGLMHELHKERFNRMDAVEYSLQHDDGRRPEEYDQADIILVGVSRVSKSVTCLCLAYRGIYAANVAYTPELALPSELLQAPAEKVIALKMNARRLQQLREARAQRWGRAMQEYVDAHRIAFELSEFNRLVDRQGWRSLDVSYTAVEDVAAEIARMAGRDATASDQLPV